jgi:biotin carboxylase
MAQTLMMVGAGAYQVPAIKMARNMGVHVVAVDRNPKAEGFEYAHEFVQVDVTDAEKCLEVARNYQVKGVMTIASDLASRAVSFIANKMGLTGPSMEVTETLFDKGSFYKLLEKAALPFARCAEARTLEEAREKAAKLRFPLIIKPSDSAGSRGVRKLNAKEGIEKEFQPTMEFSRKGSVLLCEFMEGDEYGFEGFLLGGKLVFHLVTRKIMSDAPYFVEMGHIVPVVMSPERAQKLVALIESIARALGYPSGPLNADLILAKDGFRVLEMGARLGGNSLPQITRVHTGICTIKQNIRYALGEEPIFHKMNSQPCAAYLLFAPRMGKLKGVSIPVDVMADASVAEISVDTREGTFVGPAISSNYRLGHVIATGMTGKEAAAKAIQLAKAITIEVE